MIIISDTSPIISLAAIDRLFLLENLYTNIIIPEAVAQEIVGVVAIALPSNSGSVLILD